MRFRSLGRGTAGGIIATLLIHGALVSFVVVSQLSPAPPIEETRDMIVTHMVKLGKPRDSFWLPKIVQPPRPKAPAAIKVADDPNAAPAPKEAPKVEDAEISKDLKRALTRAQALARAAADEPEEGQLTGSALGTATEASAGDAYATAIFEAIRKNWNVPTGLNVGDVANLTTEIRVSIAADGEIQNASIRKASGNDLFDDSCLGAVKATAKVPPPPAGVAAKFKRGTALEFVGKELAK
jgi:TonB family protein